MVFNSPQVGEIGAAFAVANHHGQAAAHHIGQNQRGRLRHAYHAQPRFKLFGFIAAELRPALRAGDDFGQVCHHLATVAHAECKRVWPSEEFGELVAQFAVEQDRFRPAFARAQHVAVAEPAAGGQHLEGVQLHAACHQVGHMHIVGIETGAGEGGGHFHLAVHALFAQDGDFGFRPAVDKRRGNILFHIKA